MLTQYFVKKTTQFMLSTGGYERLDVYHPKPYHNRNRETKTPPKENKLVRRLSFKFPK
ncbi:MAG TPA: hypothetical protein VMC80_00900 [Patescibacteria group bacterium]|nr:hypothetical protein [Patescibacteria group bacterium]